MKIKEILSEKELNDCQSFYGWYDEPKLEGMLGKHVEEMDIKEFCMYKYLDKLDEALCILEDHFANE